MNSPCRPRDSDCDCNEVRDMPETQLGRPALGVDRCGNDNDYEGVSMTDGGSPAGCRARGLPTFHIVRSSPPRERASISGRAWLGQDPPRLHNSRHCIPKRVFPVSRSREMALYLGLPSTSYTGRNRLSFAITSKGVEGRWSFFKNYYSLTAL